MTYVQAAAGGAQAVADFSLEANETVPVFFSFFTKDKAGQGAAGASPVLPPESEGDARHVSSRKEEASRPAAAAAEVASTKRCSSS